MLAASRNLSSRAAQTLALFMASIIIALLLAVAVASGTVLIILGRRAGHGPDNSVGLYLERFSPNMITTVLIGIAGLTFILKAGGGLYWLTSIGPAGLADPYQPGLMPGFVAARGAGRPAVP